MSIDGVKDQPPKVGSVDHSIQKIWNGTAVTNVALSDDYLYVRNGSKQIHMFYQEEHQSSYQFNCSIKGLAAEKLTAFVARNEIEAADTYAVSFTNLTNPWIVSRISHYTTGSVEYIISYNHYVYAACWEWGFPIFDFSNMTHPSKVGSLSLDTWHSIHTYCFGDYGIFSGDYNTGIYNLSANPIDPPPLWKRTKGYYSILLGRPAISYRYFVFNFKAKGQSQFWIISRENRSVYAPHISVTYSEDESYLDCCLINDNILVVSGGNNSLSFFEIGSNNDSILEHISTLYLGGTGSIEELYPIASTNSFYIAYGSNGLLKLTVNINYITSEMTSMTHSEPTTTITSETTPFPLLSLMIAIGIVIYKKRRN